jgi:hypothetical protein
MVKKVVCRCTECTKTTRGFGMVVPLTKLRHSRKDRMQSISNSKIYFFSCLFIVSNLQIVFIVIVEEEAITTNETESLENEEQLVSDNDDDITEEIQDVNFEVDNVENFDYCQGETLIDGMFLKNDFCTNQLTDSTLCYI